MEKITVVTAAVLLIANSISSDFKVCRVRAVVASARYSTRQRNLLIARRLALLNTYSASSARVSRTEHF